MVFDRGQPLFLLNVIDNDSHLYLNGAILATAGTRNMYVCICRAVTDREIRAAVEDGTRTVRGLRKQLGCAAQCGKCARQVRDIRDEVVSGQCGLAVASPA